MVRYKVLISSVQYPFTRLEYTRSYKIEPQKAVVQLPNTPDLDFSTNEFIEIYRDDDLVWKGRIKNIIKTSPTILTLEAFDLKHSLKPLLAYQREEDTYAGTQVIHQLNGTDLTQGTIENSSSIAMQYGSSDDARFDRIRVLKELCFVTGNELFMRPNGMIDFKSQCGTVKTSEIVFKHGELLNKWVKPYTINDSNKAKKIIVIGAGSGTTMICAETHTTDYSDGDPVKIIERKNLITYQTCSLAASALLDDFKNTVRYGVIDVTDTYEGRAYDVYDTIKIIDDTIGVNLNMRIAEINRTVDAKKGETTRLTLCNLQHITSNAEFLIEKGEGFVNALKNRTVEFARTEQILTTDAVREYYFARPKFLFVGESTDGYSITTTGTATLTVKHQKIKIESGSSVSTADIISEEKVLPYNKPISFQCIAKVNKTNVQLAEVGIGTRYTDDALITFRFANSKIHGRTRKSDGSYTLTELQSFNANTEYILRADYYPNDKIEFYVDGELKQTVTTNLPDEDMGVFNAAVSATTVTDVVFEIINFVVQVKW